jgi:hypothetical protein
MKLLTLAFLFLFATGCTSLKPVELAPEVLQERIFSGNIVKLGDKVKVVTSDGVRSEFKVTAITENHILGKDIDIPIRDIVALETREFSGGKTSVLVGGSFLWMYVILSSLPAILVL